MNQAFLTLPACALALFLTAATLGAGEQTQASLAAANCALDAPPDWHPIDLSKTAGMVAAFSDADGNRTLMVLTYQRGKPSEAISDAFTGGFDRGVEKAGGKKTAGKHTRVAGFEAYERRGTMNAKGRDLSTLALAVPTGDGTYLIQALAARGEAGDDPEIVQAIASFHFLHPPGQPHRSSGAYEAGKLVGQSFGGFAFLALIVLLIVRATTKRKPSSPAGFSGPYPYPQGGFPPAANVPPPLPTAPPAPAPPRPPELY